MRRLVKLFAFVSVGCTALAAMFSFLPFGYSGSQNLSPGSEVLYAENGEIPSVYTVDKIVPGYAVVLQDGEGDFIMAPLDSVYRLSPF